jgi:hypothetical protein
MIRLNLQTGFGTNGSLEERECNRCREKEHPLWWLIERRKET